MRKAYLCTINHDKPINDEENVPLFGRNAHER